MKSSKLQGIVNYRRLSDLVATAGQPNRKQLRVVAEEGFEVVLNIGLLDSPDAPRDEKEIVESLGLDYIHIPVVFNAPGRDGLERFFEAMEEHDGRKMFIHCTMNKRVSVFVALYRVLRLGWKPDDALRDVYSIWQPNALWIGFIEEMIESGRRTAP